MSNPATLSRPLKKQKSVNALLHLRGKKRRDGSFQCNMFQNCFTRCGMKIKILQPS